MDCQGNHRLRVGRVSEPGRLYLLTTVTRKRYPLFLNLWFARAVVQQLLLSVEAGSSLTLSWILMPYHLHWLIEITANILGRLWCAF